MALHRFYLESIPGDEDALLLVTGEEALHAVRVRRIAAGEGVEVLDGHGVVARGVVQGIESGRGRGGECTVEVRVERVERVVPTRPELHVWTATPKGGRVDEMIDGLSQVGAASWTPLLTERGVVSPGGSKRARLERIAAEASKQCGRAWVMAVGGEQELAGVLGEPNPSDAGPSLVIADASGGAYTATGRGVVRLLVGPEGGWTGAELRQARDGGAAVARFGPHVMRIETAAVAASVIILDAERRQAAGGA